MKDVTENLFDGFEIKKKMLMMFLITKLFGCQSVMYKGIDGLMYIELIPVVRWRGSASVKVCS